jgi:hypothetical protein
MLQQAAYDHYWSNESGINDYHVSVTCDENYNQGESIHNLLLFEITIPEGIAIRGLDETNYGEPNEQYVWGYESYSRIYDSSANVYIGWQGTGDMEWRTNYYPNSESSNYYSAFSNYFEYDTIDIYYSQMNWVGGEEETTLSVYVSNIYPDYEYRLIVYFEMAPVLSIQ